MSAIPLMNRRPAAGLAAWLILPGLCGTSILAMAAEDERYDVRLSSRDQGAIGHIACQVTGSPGVAHIKAWTSKKGSRQIQVDVKCEPHRIEESLPVARLASCSNRTGAWRCDQGIDALQMTLPDSSVVSVVPEGVVPRTAIELIAKAAALTVPPFHGRAIRLLGNTCTVRQEPTAPFKGAGNFTIRCTRGTLAMTRDCWEKACRFFITAGG